jgi:hypothetical protein
LRMRRILEPVTVATCGTPMESRRRTPICDGVRPFLANLTISCLTVSDSTRHHDGGVRRYGSDERAMPLLHAETNRAHGERHGTSHASW